MLLLQVKHVGPFSCIYEIDVNMLLLQVKHVGVFDVGGSATVVPRLLMSRFSLRPSSVHTECFKENRLLCRGSQHTRHISRYVYTYIHRSYILFYFKYIHIPFTCTGLLRHSLLIAYFKYIHIHDFYIILC